MAELKARKKIAAAADAAREACAPASQPIAQDKRPFSAPEINSWLRELPRVDPENPEY